MRAVPPVAPERPPRVWGFWGTALWGLFIFGAVFLGQMAVIVFLVLWRGGPFEMATAIHVVSGGLTISLSVLLGFPAVLLAPWIAIRPTRISVCRLSGAALDLLAQFLIGASRWRSWSEAGICCRARSAARSPRAS